MATDDQLITDPTLLSVLRAAEEARKLCLELTNLIAQQKSNNDDGEITEDSSTSRLQRELMARLSLLRGLNRNAIKLARATKLNTTEARQEIDSLHLHLSNLRYEEGHLRGEIAEAESFDHTYAKLPMISVEEFLSAHPEHSDSSEHDLTLARIADEHAARQELEKERKELVKRKEQLVKETDVKKSELAKFDVEVEKWLVAGGGKVKEILEKREQKGSV